MPLRNIDVQPAPPDLNKKTPDPPELRSRQNYYFQRQGEDLNSHEVVYQSAVQSNSIGWTQRNFFNELGDNRNTVWTALLHDVDARRDREMTSEDLAGLVRQGGASGAKALAGLKRRAEQEYLLANMVKGAMWAASEIAGKAEVAIAVRGTGLPAHLGIELGQPTKAQEFKNKTSKLEDCVLCEHIKFEDVGAVVHYDPRPEWNPNTAAEFRSLYKKKAESIDWDRNRQTFLDRLDKLRRRFTHVNPALGLNTPLPLPKLGMYQLPTEESLKKSFLARSEEYYEEDHAYRLGRFALNTKLVGPYVRLQARPENNMVGDHDLFAFMDANAGEIIADPYDAKVGRAQKLLQRSSEFQAQHGGIWYWEPSTTFNEDIKRKIMGAHGPEGKEPLVLIQADQIRAAYFCGGQEITSVWDLQNATGWMDTTHTGKVLKPFC